MVFRYGRVVTLLATRSITSGEEITVNYNYNMAVAPAWYEPAVRSILSLLLLIAQEFQTPMCLSIYYNDCISGTSYTNNSIKKKKSKENL